MLSQLVGFGGNFLKFKSGSQRVDRRKGREGLCVCVACHQPAKR